MQSTGWTRAHQGFSYERRSCEKVNSIEEKKQARCNFQTQHFNDWRLLDAHVWAVVYSSSAYIIIKIFFFTAAFFGISEGGEGAFQSSQNFRHTSPSSAGGVLGASRNFQRSFLARTGTRVRVVGSERLGLTADISETRRAYYAFHFIPTLCIAIN